MTGTIENCYAKSRNSTGTTNAIGWTSSDGPHTATNVEVKDAAAFASGEVCYKLNHSVTDGTQKWYQTLESDPFPVLNNRRGTVYYGYDGNVMKYSNSLQSLSSINNVAYIDADGNPQTADNVTKITDTSTTLNAGWYVVFGNDVRTGALVCNGAVHLILADGAKLTTTGNDDNSTPGIQVSGGSNSLTIYGQTTNRGNSLQPVDHVQPVSVAEMKVTAPTSLSTAVLLPQMVETAVLPASVAELVVPAPTSQSLLRSPFAQTTTLRLQP